MAPAAARGSRRPTPVFVVFDEVFRLWLPPPDILGLTRLWLRFNLHTPLASAIGLV